jgi:hypothetical protein
MNAASETVDEAGEEAGEELAPKPGFVLRLKRLLALPLRLLGRLRKPQEVDAEEDAAPDAGRDRREASDESEALPAAPPLWRRILPYALVLLAGATAGGGALYALSARVIAHQSARLAEQAEEVARLKDVLAGYDRMTLQQKKKLDEEQGRRAELQNRLATAQADLARGHASPAPEPGAATAAGGSHVRGQSGDCTLRPGSIGSTLKACLEKFNR